MLITNIIHVTILLDFNFLVFKQTILCIWHIIHGDTLMCQIWYDNVNRQQEVNWPHRSPEKPVQNNENIWAKLWLFKYQQDVFVKHNAPDNGQF